MNGIDLSEIDKYSIRCILQTKLLIVFKKKVWYYKTCIYVIVCSFLTINNYIRFSLHHTTKILLIICYTLCCNHDECIVLCVWLSVSNVYWNFGHDLVKLFSNSRDVQLDTENIFPLVTIYLNSTTIRCDGYDSRILWNCWVDFKYSLNTNCGLLK